PDVGRDEHDLGRRALSGAVDAAELLLEEVGAPLVVRDDHPALASVHVMERDSDLARLRDDRDGALAGLELGHELRPLLRRRATSYRGDVLRAECVLDDLDRVGEWGESGQSIEQFGADRERLGDLAEVDVLRGLAGTRLLDVLSVDRVDRALEPGV